MSRCIPHPLWLISWFPGNPTGSPRLGTQAQLFLSLPQSPKPCWKEWPKPYPGLSLDLWVTSLVLRITDFNFTVMKAKHTWYFTMWHGDSNEEKTGERTSYLVLRIFRNCKISENWISLRALKNLKPGKRKETEMHYFQCMVLMFALCCGIYSWHGRRGWSSCRRLNHRYLGHSPSFRFVTGLIFAGKRTCSSKGPVRSRSGRRPDGESPLQ